MIRVLALGLFVAISLTSLPRAIGQNEPAVEIVDAAVPVAVVPGQVVDFPMALDGFKRIGIGPGPRLIGRAVASPVTVRLVPREVKALLARSVVEDFTSKSPGYRNRKDF